MSESLNFGDITKHNEWDIKSDIDILTYGFPCQDISLAGKQQGFMNEDGTLTRSGLFFEALGVIEKCKPKIAIAENVKNLVSKKFSEQFNIVLNSLSNAGYNNYYKVLNAKDYGIPQNRERVFIVSIRKDIDNGLFEFPTPYPLEKRLKDLLEVEVDEKFYLTNAQIERIKSSSYVSGSRRIQEKDWCDTLCARDFKDAKCIQVAKLFGGTWDKSLDMNRRVYDINGISPTLRTCQGGGAECKVLTDSQPFVMIPEKTKKGYKEAYAGDGVYLNRPYQKRGCVQKGMIQTLKTSGGDIGVITEKLRVRKLTPKEYWRLMGFSDDAFERAARINSNTQLYKQAGNSIVVDVLEELFCQIFDENGEIYV